MNACMRGRVGGAIQRWVELRGLRGGLFLARCVRLAHVDRMHIYKKGHLCSRTIGSWKGGVDG